MPQITPCLWFDGQGEEAAELYTSLFPDSRIVDVRPGPEGRAQIVSFELDGQPFLALNGGPEFTFSEAVSFVVDCRDQDEVDHYWNALTADGGEESMCGWLKDRFGLSWQIVPKRLLELLRDDDPDRARRATEAMLQMRKIEVAELERAASAE